MENHDRLLKALISGSNEAVAEIAKDCKLPGSFRDLLTSTDVVSPETVRDVVRVIPSRYSLSLAICIARTCNLHKFQVAARPLLDCSNLDRLSHDYLQATLLYQQYNESNDCTTHEKIKSICNHYSGDTSLAANYISAVAQHRLGLIYTGMGMYSQALHSFKDSISTSQKISDVGVCVTLQDLATLYWKSGQFRQALKIYAEVEPPSGHKNTRFRIRTHLSAAKCAIDMGVAAKATYELGEAKDLIDADLEKYQRLNAYLILYSAECDTLWGNVAEGIHLFEYAIELFENLEHPDHEGLNQAKAGLILHEFRRGEYGPALSRLGELIDECNESGCLDTRTRLLAYKARLLLKRGPERELLRAAYDDLIHRVHLMNNPYLTFLAYSDLFFYAREELSKEDQKFWLDRLRGLRPLLERSCYEDLYTVYMTERLREEIETDLDSLGIKWQLPHDD